MRRRDFITLVGGAAAWPIAVRAQQSGGTRRLVVVSSTTGNDVEGQARIAALGHALEQLGWTGGRNLLIDYRWAGGDAERVRVHAAEAVALAPDAIIGNGSVIIAALKQATRSIPIVFVLVTDPVGDGFVASLSRPGGNISGFTHFEHAIAGKWVGLLNEAVPRLARVAVIQNPTNPAWAGYVSAMETAASSVGVQVISAGVRDPAEIAPVVEAFAREPNGAIVILPDATTTSHRESILVEAIRHRLPSVGPFRYFATSGALMSYGVGTIEQYRRAASYAPLEWRHRHAHRHGLKSSGANGPLMALLGGQLPTS
jgi:putative ABC transport system substrate-binding protein